MQGVDDVLNSRGGLSTVGGHASEDVPCLCPTHRMGALACRATVLSGGGTAAMRSGVTRRRAPSITAAVPCSLVLLCRSMVTCMYIHHPCWCSGSIHTVVKGIMQHYADPRLHSDIHDCTRTQHLHAPLLSGASFPENQGGVRKEQM